MNVRGKLIEVTKAKSGRPEYFDFVIDDEKGRRWSFRECEIRDLRFGMEVALDDSRDGSIASRVEIGALLIPLLIEREP